MGGCCVQVLGRGIGGIEPAIPVMLAPEAFGGPSPARPGADMEAGSVKTRSYPRISTLIRGLHKCDYLDRLHFSEKKTFFILRFGGWGCCFLFLIFRFWRFRMHGYGCTGW